MKNKLIVSAMLAGLLMFSSSSYGRSGWYAGVDLGVGFASDADTAGSATDSPTNPTVNANAAGTASLVNKQSLDDTLFGYQFLMLCQIIKQLV